MLILGIDPGLRTGTGLAVIDAKRRTVERAQTFVITSWPLADECTRWRREGLVRYVGIERMTAMGSVHYSQKTLDNAQFVGEARARLDERGFLVHEITKREALLSIGCKGKASAARVRRCVYSLFKVPGKLTDHEVDAVAVAWATWLKIRRMLLDG